MTACVNNQNEVKGGVSHKVLRSVVAGVLAVSMVPTTALAADANVLTITADSAESAKISEISVTGYPAVYDGKSDDTLTVSFKDSDTTDSLNGKYVVLVGPSGFSSLNAAIVDSGTSANTISVTLGSSNVKFLSGEYSVYLSDDTDGEAGTDYLLTTFSVAKADLSEKVKINESGYAITVEGFAAAAEGADYEVTVNGEKDTTNDNAVTGIGANGSYFVEIAGKGNFTGYYSAVYSKGNVTDAQASLQNGKAVVTDQAGNTVSADKSGEYTLAYNGESQYVVVSSIAPEGSDKTLVAGADFDVAYYDTADMGQEIKDMTSFTSGKRYVAKVTVTAEGQYKDLVRDFYFSIDNAKLKGAFAYEGDDMADTEFTWDGQAVDASFAIGNAALTSSDVDVEWYLSDGTTATDTAADKGGAGSSKAAPKNAGTYYAKLTGKGAYQGSTYMVPVTIGKLDLSKAILTAEDVDDNSSLPEVMFDGTDVKPEVDSVVLDDQTGWVNGEKGKYTYTLTAAEDDANVTGSATVSFNLVGALASGYKYGNESTELVDNGYLLKDDDYTYTVGDKDLFDASEVIVLDGEGKALESDEYTVVVKDEEGNVVTDWNKPGKYTVVVSVNVPSDFSLGGTTSCKFEVVGGQMSDVTATVTYKGDVASSINHTYDGTDVLDSVKVTVKDGTKVLTEGVDYEIVAKKGTKEVDSIVDAGAYELEIKGVSYTGSSIEVGVNVAQAAITGLKVQQPENIGGIVYTGEKISPAILYTTDDISGDKLAKAEWKVLDPEAYFLSGFEFNAKEADNYEPVSSDDVVEAGYYTCDFSLSTKGTNYKVGSISNADYDATGLAFSIVKLANFNDVPAGEWYAGVVNKAFANKYMSGWSDNIFAPNAMITRAEVAAVMANMACVYTDGSDGKGYWSPVFSDVTYGAWFDDAVCWAYGAGIMGGYGNGAFGPNDQITREQVACTVYNYAKAMGDDMTVEDVDGALAKYSDAASVDSWAAEAVAWCVERGVMGNGSDEFRPLDKITRAEIAAIAVNYQPEMLDETFKQA